MRIPAYGSNGWVNHDVKKLADSMTAMAARGFKILKMKVGVERGGNIAEDIRRVKEVRRAIGAKIGLAVDANQCWNVEQALEFAEGIAGEDIDWFEEPIPAYDFLGAAEFARRSPVKPAAGESLRSHHEFTTLLEMKALPYLQPAPMGVGGTHGFMRVARVAEKYQAPLVSGGFSQYTCSLVAASPTGLLTEYLIPFMDRFQEMLASSPVLADGDFVIPETPGHGLTPDMDYVEAHCPGGPEEYRDKPAPFVRAF
jgi:D-arabinonate dehydratase